MKLSLKRITLKVPNPSYTLFNWNKIKKSKNLSVDRWCTGYSFIFNEKEIKLVAPEDARQNDASEEEDDDEDDEGDDAVTIE